MSEITVEVAVPNREASSQMTAELANTLQNIEKPEGCDDEFRVRINHSYLQPVDANRNTLVKSFLDRNDPADWLIMIDNDVVPPNDFLQLVTHGQPVVSGVVTIIKGQFPQPVIVRQNGKKFQQMDLSKVEDDIRDDGLIAVDGIGTGCVAIKREVLENMNPPWFEFKYNEYGGLKMGEDFQFARKLRNADIPLYVDTDVMCSHFKKVDLTQWAMTVRQAEQGNLDENVEHEQ